MSRLRNLIPYFGDLYLHEIESYHIVEYSKQRLQEKAANWKNLANPGTVNREVGLLRSMINLAAEWIDLELRHIKYEMAKEEPKERILTEQEIRRLIENSEAPLRHIILVALNKKVARQKIFPISPSHHPCSRIWYVHKIPDPSFDKIIIGIRHQASGIRHQAKGKRRKLGS